MSGRSNIFAKDAGALKPLEGSNPSGSAIFEKEFLNQKYGRREARSVPGISHLGIQNP